MRREEKRVKSDVSKRRKLRRTQSYGKEKRDRESHRV